MPISDERFLKAFAESMEKIQAQIRGRVVSYRGNVRVDTANKRSGERVLPGVQLVECRVWS